MPRVVPRQQRNQSWPVRPSVSFAQHSEVSACEALNGPQVHSVSKSAGTKPPVLLEHKGSSALSTSPLPRGTPLRPAALCPRRTVRPSSESPHSHRPWTWHRHAGTSVGPVVDDTVLQHFLAFDSVSVFLGDEIRARSGCCNVGGHQCFERVDVDHRESNHLAQFTGDAPRCALACRNRRAQLRSITSDLPPLNETSN